MKNMRRGFAIFMALIMILALLPTAAFAMDEAEEEEAALEMTAEILEEEEPVVSDDEGEEIDEPADEPEIIEEPAEDEEPADEEIIDEEPAEAEPEEVEPEEIEEELPTLVVDEIMEARVSGPNGSFSLTVNLYSRKNDGKNDSLANAVLLPSVPAELSFTYSYKCRQASPTSVTLTGADVGTTTEGGTIVWANLNAYYDNDDDSIDTGEIVIDFNGVEIDGYTFDKALVYSSVRCTLEENELFNKNSLSGAVTGNRAAATIDLYFIPDETEVEDVTVTTHYLKADGTKDESLRTTGTLALFDDMPVAINKVRLTVGDHSYVSYYLNTELSNENATKTGSEIGDDPASVLGTSIHIYYDIDNWNDANDAIGEDGILDKDQALVNFVVDDEAHGSVAQTMRVFTVIDEDNDAATRNFFVGSVETESNKGFVFSHWTVNGVTLDPDEVMIPLTAGSDAATVVANFIASPVVNFKADADNAGTEVTADIDGKVTAPAAPTKEGYTFAGWTIDGEAFDPDTDTVTESADAMAVWTPVDVELTIHYKADGETIADDDVIQVPYLTEYEVEPKLIVGYLPKADAVSGEINVTVTMDDLDGKAVTLEYEAATVTVTFETNGGTEMEAMEIGYGATLSGLNNPTRSGYRFGGWQKDGANFDTTAPITEDITLTAIWNTIPSNPPYNPPSGGGSTGGSTGGGSGSTGGGSSSTEPEPEENTSTEQEDNGEEIDIFEEDTALAAKPMIFEDVTTDDWFYDAVKYVWDNDLMNGTETDKFDPTVATTRGMLITILYRMDGEPEVEELSKFTDVDAEMYYAEPIAWALANGIIAETEDDTFGPNEIATREEMVVALYRFAQYKEMDVSEVEDADIQSYNDALEINENSVSAFQWACGAGLIQGTGEGNLDPQGETERSHLAALLTRFDKMVKGTETTEAEKAEDAE